MPVYRTIICLILFVPTISWAQTPTPPPSPTPTPGYFESHYNKVPNTGGPSQLKMLGTWGYFMDTAGYPNDYRPAAGDETGAFWNNGTDDVLVGVTTITQPMADDRAYGQLDIFGNDPDTHEEASEGLLNGATIFFRVYDTTGSGEYDADPTLSFQNGEMWTEQTLAVDLPSTPTPPPAASPTPSTVPTTSPIPSATPAPTIASSPTTTPTAKPTVPPLPTSSPTASPPPTMTPF